MSDTRAPRHSYSFHAALFSATQSISPGMVDTDFLSVYRTTGYAALPKLLPADVTGAVLYALGTPDNVQVRACTCWLLRCAAFMQRFIGFGHFGEEQVEEIMLQAIQRFDNDVEPAEH